MLAGVPPPVMLNPRVTNRLAETQLCMLLAEVSGKRSSDFNGLELEQLQLLVCKQLGFVAVREYLGSCQELKPLLIYTPSVNLLLS